ncbi:amino acid racemase [candidate division KSB3 bacterium]|uniref:Amino acid racemase n=1 Tax=candidate division KSB3 bacterium TaxID=2044937 RepID=A0A9D5Q7M2_9BACT|nr:amino acid racemase [candidate division KSB3 bacterium]MBD3326593.1 amino acid racemase [candidate division KSB3 bacterium]
MKTIGLIGGMSWESSLEYYRIINEGVKARLGGLHSAQCLLYSVDFAEIETLQAQGNWNAASDYLIDAARRLERGGADFILICTNTMHKIAAEVQAQISIPLLHIADVTGRQVQQQGLRTVGLLGTKFTMEEAFYTDYLTDKYQLHVLIPEELERESLHRIIFDELCLGQMLQTSKERVLQIIAKLVEQGAEGIVLGCTEIPLLIKQPDSPVPVFDTTRIHADAAVEAACQEN